MIQSEGRNYISRTDRKFDVILLGFVDSWASVASGGLSLSENYLYTTQAFEGYYNHLTDDGVLAILRWDVDVPRLVSNAIALLGVEEARKRIVVLYEKREGDRENPPQMIFMFRKRPFTEAETARDHDRLDARRSAARAGPQGDAAVRRDLRRARSRWRSTKRSRRSASTRCSTTARSTSRPKSRGACPTGCARA